MHWFHGVEILTPNNGVDVSKIMGEIQNIGECVFLLNYTIIQWRWLQFFDVQNDHCVEFPCKRNNVMTIHFVSSFPNRQTDKANKEKSPTREWQYWNAFGSQRPLSKTPNCTLGYQADLRDFRCAISGPCGSYNRRPGQERAIRSRLIEAPSHEMPKKWERNSAARKASVCETFSALSRTSWLAFRAMCKSGCRQLWCTSV